MICGLSPLARGTRAASEQRQTGPRFIPARAGNTLKEAAIGSMPSVYPRSRGEHARERGTRARALFNHGRNRFIPARAGNTFICVLETCAPTVYPRSRGEHDYFADARDLAGGLSPLARGTQKLNTCIPYRRRFIPARAGNTCLMPTPQHRGSVYPRSRGEHNSLVDNLLFADGLSPLARGTLYLQPLRVVSRRFIPARAGNTLKLYNCSIRKFFTSNNPPTFSLHLHILKEQLTY